MCACLAAPDVACQPQGSLCVGCALHSASLKYFMVQPGCACGSQSDKVFSASGSAPFLKIPAKGGVLPGALRLCTGRGPIAASLGLLALCIDGWGLGPAACCWQVAHVACSGHHRTMGPYVGQSQQATRYACAAKGGHALHAAKPGMKVAWRVFAHTQALPRYARLLGPVGPCG